MAASLLTIRVHKTPVISFKLHRVMDKSRDQLLTHNLSVKKKITLKSENKKVTLSVGKAHRLQRCMRSFFLMSDAIRWKVSAVTEHGSSEERLSICLASWVRTRCQVVYESEHCCTCERRRPYTSTVCRQVTDCSKQVITWRDLRGLLYSHSDSMGLLIQSNFIWIATMKIC
jgi:hypothetical protein